MHVASCAERIGLDPETQKEPTNKELDLQLAWHRRAEVGRSLARTGVSNGQTVVMDEEQQFGCLGLMKIRRDERGELKGMQDRQMGRHQSLSTSLARSHARHLPTENVTVLGHWERRRQSECELDGWDDSKLRKVRVIFDENNGATAAKSGRERPGHVTGAIRTVRNNTKTVWKIIWGWKTVVHGLAELGRETAGMWLRMRRGTRLKCQKISGTRFGALGTMLNCVSGRVRLLELEIGTERNLRVVQTGNRLHFDPPVHSTIPRRAAFEGFTEYLTQKKFWNHTYASKAAFEGFTEYLTQKKMSSKLSKKGYHLYFDPPVHSTIIWRFWNHTYASKAAFEGFTEYLTQKKMSSKVLNSYMCLQGCVLWIYRIFDPKNNEFKGELSKWATTSIPSRDLGGYCAVSGVSGSNREYLAEHRDTRVSNPAPIATRGISKRELHARDNFHQFNPEGFTGHV
ncbi:hypothetical protein B0H13DRAFT_1888696 [Mycena leptocephala]|nr:hypothetical protein B0H13DRAFT_1888696 [Mycena leptocephala]